jgi:predicted DNA-binding transcriptional regulator YafY
MSKTDRFSELVVMLFQGKTLYKESIADLLDVSKRTASRYVNNLKKLDIPLDEEDTPAGTRLYLAQSEKGKHLLQIDNLEAISINIALSIFNEFNEDILFDKLKGLKTKIETLISAKNNNEYDEISENWKDRKFLALSFLPLKYNIENEENSSSFEQVITALYDEAQLEFKYPDKKKMKKRKVNPLTLVYYKGGFYLLANDTKNQDHPFCFSLSKMKNAQADQLKAADIPKEWNPALEFNKSSGMLPGDELKINLTFENELHDYVVFRKWPEKTNITKNEYDFNLETTIIVNNELLKWIIGFGDKVKVNSPTEVIEKIKSHLKKTLDLYESRGNSSIK